LLLASWFANNTLPLSAAMGRQRIAIPRSDHLPVLPRGENGGGGFLHFASTFFSPEFCQF
jgi:hypothetical protein